MFHYLNKRRLSTDDDVHSYSAAEFWAATDCAVDWLQSAAAAITADAGGGAHKTDKSVDVNTAELRVVVMLDQSALLIWLVALRRLSIPHLLIDPSLPAAVQARGCIDFHPTLGLVDGDLHQAATAVRDFLPPDLWLGIHWYRADPELVAGPVVCGQKLGVADAQSAIPAAEPAATWLCDRTGRVTFPVVGSGAEHRQRTPSNKPVKSAPRRWLFGNGLWHQPTLTQLLVALYDGADCVVLAEFNAAACVAALKQYQITHALFADWTVPNLASALTRGIGGARIDQLQQAHFVGEQFSPHGVRSLADCLSVPIEFLYFPACTPAYTPALGLPLLTLDDAGWSVAQDDQNVHPPQIAIELFHAGCLVETAYETGLVYLRVSAERTASEACGQPSGYYCTEQLGYKDSEGGLHLRGALERQLRYRGRLVLAPEIERVLMTHVAVQEAWVGLVDTTQAGAADLVALVSLVANAKPTPVLAVTLLDYCAELVAASRRPAAIYFIGAMPRFRSGTIDERAIMDAAFYKGTLSFANNPLNEE